MAAKLKSSKAARSDALSLFHEANTLWESGHNRRAYKLFLDSALLGQPSAQHNIGYFYDVGIGTKKDRTKALFWYKKAWKADRQTGTCANIAQLYAESGNRTTALRWWRRAVDLGDGDAAVDLAKFYLDKGGRQRHISEAVALLRKALRSTRTTDDAVREANRLLKLYARGRSRTRLSALK